jgi:tetratricopeptide (TPR) repeat protein
LQALLAESSSYKARANDLFKEKNYEDAIAGYNEALEVCPKYLSYDRAVIKSNIAACHLHTSAWKDAITASSEALDLLDPKPETKEESEKGGNDGEQLDDNEEVEEKWEDAKEEPEEEADEEIISAGAAKAEPIPDMKKQRENDEDRIRVKALMRRAKARTELGGWSTLQAAEEGMSS